jgi:hypothetical protein
VKIEYYKFPGSASVRSTKVCEKAWLSRCGDLEKLSRHRNYFTRRKATGVCQDLPPPSLSHVPDYSLQVARHLSFIPSLNPLSHRIFILCRFTQRRVLYELLSRPAIFLIAIIRSIVSKGTPVQDDTHATPHARTRRDKPRKGPHPACWYTGFARVLR